MAVNSARVVLLVDDDTTTAYLVQFMLEREGFEVLYASDGRAAQSKIEAMAQPPALIIFDVILPFVDGMELLQIARRKPGWQDTPIIMLTSKSQEQDVVRAFKLGATDYVVKPFQPNEFLARVKRLMQSRVTAKV